MEQTIVKSFLLILLGLVIGAIAGVFLLSPFIMGIGTGVGVATGLKAGACLTVEAAKESGLITAEQVGEVLNAAMRTIASTEIDGAAALSAGDAECAKVVEELKAAASR
jgi:hypothetical protein